MNVTNTQYIIGSNSKSWYNALTYLCYYLGYSRLIFSVLSKCPLVQFTVLEKEELSGTISVSFNSNSIWLVKLADTEFSFC